MYELHISLLDAPFADERLHFVYTDEDHIIAAARDFLSMGFWVTFVHRLT